MLSRVLDQWVLIVTVMLVGPACVDFPHFRVEGNAVETLVNHIQLVLLPHVLNVIEFGFNNTTIKTAVLSVVGLLELPL